MIQAKTPETLTCCYPERNNHPAEALRGETHICPQESISYNKLKVKWQKGNALSQDGGNEGGAGEGLKKTKGFDCESVI